MNSNQILNMNEKEIERKLKIFLETMMELSDSKNLSTRKLAEIAAKKAGFIIHEST